MNNRSCSVIIPTYNASATILRAIDSVRLNDEKNNIEVIIIDDGSVDDTEDILESYCKKWSDRIKYIYKENGGVSSARNLGLSHACGKYVFFMDADDTLNRSILDNMVECAENQNADLVIADYVEKNVLTGKCSEISAKIPYNVLLDSGYIEKNIFCRYFVEDNVGLSNLWNKLFSLDFIKQHKIMFDETRTHGEDWAFCINCFMYAKRLYAVNSAVYNYNLDGTQTYQKYKTNLGEGFVKGYKTKKELNNKYNICFKDSHEYRLFQERFYYQILSYLKAGISPQEKKVFLRSCEVKECLKYLMFLSSEKLNDVGFSRRDKFAFLLLYVGMFNIVIKKLYK